MGNNFKKKWHYHWVILRFIVLCPFFLIYTLGKYAEIIGLYLAENLPKAYTAYIEYRS